MDETARVEGYLKDLLNVMVSRAEKEVDAVMPGYTHLQVSRIRPLTFRALCRTLFHPLPPLVAWPPR
jgi:argininosuccinate lyase